MIDFAAEWLQSIGDAFLNPQKRVFAGYLLSAMAIAVIAMALAHGGGLRAALRRIFDPKVWFSRSARTDYLIVFINRAVMMLTAPWLVARMAFGPALFLLLHEIPGGRFDLWPGAPLWAVALLFTAAYFVLDDLSRYLVHRLMHAWPVLWAFHKVHHTAETLTPFTVYRTHPVEGFVFAARSAVVQGLLIPVFVFFFADRVDLMTVIGANIFLFAFNAAGSNLRHSHIAIRYGRLEKLLVSPAQHQLHHSLDPRHFVCNFGAALSVWDRIGGSWVPSERGQVLRFGVAASERHDVHGLYGVYLHPFVDAASAVARRLSPHRITSDLMTVFSAVRNRLPRRRAAAALLAGALALPLAADRAAAKEGELDIYSHRQPFLIQPFIDAFTAETGVKVNMVYASKGLAQRLLIEGKRSPADVVLTVDIGRLAVYSDKDLLAEVNSPTLAQHIPAHLRDPGNRWFAFSTRARVIAVSKERVPEGAVTQYEDLADPKWKGRICSRPGSHVYNRALMASMIAADGAEAAEKWAEGLVSNLARRPQGNDRAQVKAIAEGECDIAIINHYYYGNLLTSDQPEQRDWAASIRLVFPNQDGRGAHVNISGGGVAKYADNKEMAVRFLEFLTSDKAQHLYADINTEYPVNPEVPLPDALKAWGAFRADTLPIVRIAELAPEAQRMIDRVGW
ncbi:MAG: extracellular solute-binding protein [Minwuia sp.]|uniref:extracellular solute-binding protein n=1 Tax=Minwuia sp. TaxID=2493630 RepID=UPI003A881EEC